MVSAEKEKNESLLNLIVFILAGSVFIPAIFVASRFSFFIIAPILVILTFWALALYSFLKYKKYERIFSGSKIPYSWEKHIDAIDSFTGGISSYDSFSAFFLVFFSLGSMFELMTGGNIRTIEILLGIAIAVILQIAKIIKRKEE